MGTRLVEETEVRPKPMVEIGGYPVLWHILNGYASAGLRHFVIALGYRGEMIKSFFVDYRSAATDITVWTSTGEVELRGAPPADWEVDLVDTGLATQTGGRVLRLRDWLPDDQFCLTYGDGVSDVDLCALIAFHRKHGKLATITAVRPPARFGGLVLDHSQVTNFSEKPQIGEGWINGGFMVLDRRVIDRIGGDESSLERDVLEPLAEEGELMAFCHEQFWQSMDTLRDVRLLRSMWDGGAPAWRTWK
jgi:glucose-1-phosphate cytidylyltransferase